MKKIYRIIHGNKTGGYKRIEDYDDNKEEAVEEVWRILLEDTPNGRNYIFNEDKLKWTYDNDYYRIETYTIHPLKIIYTVNDRMGFCSCVISSHDSLEDAKQEVEKILNGAIYTFDEKGQKYRFNDKEDCYYYIQREEIYDELS